MNRKRKVYIYLTGGLGNQLFQLSAAMKFREGFSCEIILDTALGAPRTTEGYADISHLVLPKNVLISNKKSNFVVRKALGFLLRMGLNPRGLQQINIVKKLYKLMGGILLSLRHKSCILIIVANNVGFVNLDIAKGSYLVGYFQSYRFLESMEVKNDLQVIRPKLVNEKLALLIDKATLEKPIFVHFRFQDYLTEATFGVPSRDYYLKSLLTFNPESRSIWVFSDNMSMAKAYAPKEFKTQYYFVYDRDLSPAQLLHLFRFGADYVIANSTFSWWGATLAFNKQRLVVAPTPWFKDMKEPLDLIPPHWIREKAYFD